MIKRNYLIPNTVLFFLIIIFVGCTSESNKSEISDVPDLPPATVDTDAHNHPSEGPHHGHLIELGKEEYHAEFVHNEKNGTVTIYILDGTAKKVVPIDAKEIVINLKHDGRGEQFKLAALPDEGDPVGQSSRFVSKDKELNEDLHAKDADARLALRIAGKSYSGKIEHDHHEHGDHDHKH
ncbi:MAG: hypothetical protein CME31_26775 [Gimesia sp.]|nr:hypothetical protein [Gimesia sp.]|tara:strand:- start:22345 stop:22884 length:540 start_codon:yes stop_codon:yes gene_type:complete